MLQGDLNNKTHYMDDDQIRSLCGAKKYLTGLLQLMAKLMFGNVN